MSLKFRLYKQGGALNSLPVFNALEKGIISQGHRVVDKNEDVLVLWSGLFRGRMKVNYLEYQRAKAKGVIVLFLEVGTLLRGVTWKLSIGNVNGLGNYGIGILKDRSKTLGISLKQYTVPKRILICTQHTESIQWNNGLSMNDWLDNTISRIREYSDLPIFIRPHPRARFEYSSPYATVEYPKLITNSYDSYDFDPIESVVVNYNSGPGVIGAINGSVVITDQSSLCKDITLDYRDLSDIRYPDRTQWFEKILHTEWTISELESGYPISRYSEFDK